MSKEFFKTTYWAHQGKYKELAEKLHERIPQSGEVVNPRKNRELERFRKASNFYYDLYNDKLKNFAREFPRIFKVASANYRTEKGFTVEFYQLVEKRMDELILIAAQEQKLV